MDSGDRAQEKAREVEAEREHYETPISPPTDAIEWLSFEYLREYYTGKNPYGFMQATDAKAQLSVLVSSNQLGKELARIVREYVDGNSNENWDDCGLVNAVDAYDDAVKQVTA